MYIADCTYRLGAAGLIFLSDGSGEACHLRVTFTPLAYYPEEPDVGAGADFDAAIASIEIRDLLDGESEKAWHRLEAGDFDAARRFLDRHFNGPMWSQAEAETAAAFGADAYRWAA